MPRKRRRRLDPRSYPKSVRDRVEIDYADKLGSEDRQWLAAFNEAEYGSNPSFLQLITGKYVSVVERRRLMREIKRYQRDVLSECAMIFLSGPDWLRIRTPENPEEALIEKIDNEVYATRFERVLMQILKESVLLKQWRKHGKA